MLLFITVAIFLCTVMFLILSGLALLQCSKSYLSEAAAIVKERSRSKATTGFAPSPAATEDCEAAPPALPRRQRKKGKNAKSVTTGSYLDPPAPATAHSSLLGSSAHVDSGGSARSFDGAEKTFERNLRQTEARESNGVGGVDAVDPGESAPRLTMADLSPALGCVCRRGAAHDFHVNRLVRLHAPKEPTTSFCIAGDECQTGSSNAHHCRFDRLLTHHCGLTRAYVLRACPQGNIPSTLGR